MTPADSALRFAKPPAEMRQQDFMAIFGGIYEHSDWVAATIWNDGIDDADTQLAHLADRMRHIVDEAGHDRQLALLRAHPELAGKLAIAGKLTADSTSEQAGAGLDQCTAEEFDRFQALNSRYGSAFGHPFIIAVRGLNRGDILAAFETRITNDPGTEFATALAEVHKIAHLRLSNLCI